MKAAVIALMIAVSLTGCFASKPPNNVGFVNSHSLQELAGTYKNLGESKEPGYFLSQSIWPQDKTLRHDAITAISVQAIGDTALAVRAFQGSDVVKEGVYISGKDFEFSNGRLHLRTRTENSLKEPEAGGLFVARISEELGIDERGQGKSKKQETIVGAAYLVVPIAIGINTEVRYARIVGP